MSKIIAFIDGSIYSASICETAAWVAGRIDAPVEIIHLLGRAGAAPSDLSGQIELGARSALMAELATLDEQRAKLVAHRGRAILDDAAEIMARAGVANVTTELRQGELLETLAEREDDARVILIGKRGVNADMAMEHLGSNLERIVRAAKKPVLVCARAFKPVEKVLIAYDGGPSAMKAVDHLSRSPLFAGLKVLVVRVGADNPMARRSLKDAQALLAAAGIEAETRLLPGSPDAVLGKLVEEEGFEMVVMGAYGHSRIRNLIIGSTTTAMIRSCKVPLLLMR